MIVEVKDYNTQVEFPDDTHPEIIKKVLAERFPPVKAPPTQQVEPTPFDLDGHIGALDPLNEAQPGAVGEVLYPLVKPWLAVGNTAAAALNKGLAAMATHLDVMADYVAAKTGASKGNLFKDAAKQYQDNVSYWQDRANKVGVSFLEELFGEVVGGAVPGVAEFALNIPYAGLLGAATASQQGKSEIAGALTEAAKRGVLGLVFKTMHPLNQYLRAPAMGTVFGIQTATEGGDAREVAKGFGTGMLFSLSSPGGKMGLNEIRRNMEKQIVLEEAKKPVEIAPEEAALEVTPDMKAAEPAPEIVQPGATKAKSAGAELADAMTDTPVYQAILEIKRQGGLNHKALVDVFGAEETAQIVNKNPGLVSKEGGAKLDAVAEDFGFESDVAFKDALMDKKSKKAVAKETRDQFEAVHGEDIALAKKGFEKTPDGVVAGDLQKGDKIFMNDDTFKVKGYAKNGDVILEDGRTFKVDAFEKLKADGVKWKAQPAEEPASAMAPEAGFRREPSSVGESNDPITRRSDLVRFLTEKLDIPIRTGRFQDRALGIFKPKLEVIRTQNANDIEVISHEIGHAIQKFLYPESLKAKGLTSQPFAAHSGELEPLATKPKAGQEIIPEGFAEFVRLYVTDPNQARAKAPSFYDHFEHLLDTKSPESLEILLAARGHYQKYLEQPALQRVLSQISVGETGDRKNTLHDAYTAAFDEIHPLKQIVDEMAPRKRNRYFRLQDTIAAADNPYKLARNLKGWTGKVDAFLRHKPFDFNTYEDVGKSLQEIVKPIDGKLEEFRAYIVSKRTLELSGREEKIETGVLPADAKEIVEKYDADFSQTFKDLKEYQDHTLNYLKDSGVIGDDTYAKIKALNDDYVPLYRVMEATEGKGIGIGAGLEAKSPIKKIKGSWRDIQDPLESIIKNTYLYVNMAEKNAIGAALVNLAEKNDGLGKFVEKIPTPMQAVKITPEELSKFGLENIPENAVAVFRPSAFMPKENVIAVYRDGKPELYQVHPDVARTFQALDKESVHALAKLLSYPASWLRAGATLTPEFIARNPARDQFSAFVYSKYGFIPGVDLVRGVFELAGKTDVYWDWKKGGGDHSMLVSMDRAYMQDQLVDVLQKYPVRNLIRNPIEGLRVLSELGEAGTRIGEFKKGVEAEGRTKEGIIEAAFAAREVTLDFQRKGASGKAMNMITAFWNAALQGQDKMFREFYENPVGMAWKTAVAITLPSVLLAIATHNDDRIKDVPQWQRDTFWIIPTDNAIYRIPKPFELGVLFGSVPERITHYLLDKDPHSFDGLLQSIGRAGLPGVVPTAAIPIMENWANRSSFFDRPIVPQNRTDLLSEYQYGPYTSETAKALGKVLGKLPWMNTLPVSSPAKIENLVYGWTGGLGRYAMNLMDVSLETAGIVKQDYEKPGKTLADYPLIRAFVVRYPSASTENITRFYDDYETVTKKINSLKAMQKEGRFDEAMKIMEGGDLENLNGIHQALRNVHSMVDAVTINPMIKAEEKREFIDILYMQMTDIARAGNQHIDMIREMEKQIKEDQKGGVMTPARTGSPATGLPIFQ